MKKTNNKRPNKKELVLATHLLTIAGPIVDAGLGQFTFAQLARHLLKLKKTKKK